MFDMLQSELINLAVLSISFMLLVLVNRKVK